MCDEYPKEFMVPQFADVNLLLQFSVGASAEGSIFKEAVPCLSTGSALVCRMKVDANTTVWKYIRGEHLLRIIGWLDADEDEDWTVCQTLAGNAFSAFSFSAVCIAALAALSKM